MAAATKDKPAAKAQNTRGGDEEDRRANLKELADQFGEGVGNAEELINANAALRTQELAAISSLPVIQTLTDEIDLDKVDAGGKYVVDAAWRGSGRTRGLVAIVEDENGNLDKVLVESNHDERPANAPRKSSHAKEREDTGNDE